MMGRLATLWILVIGCVVLSTALLVCAEFPRSGIAHGIAAVLPAPDVAATDYDDALGAAFKAPMSSRTLLYASAERSAWREVQTAPMKPEAWLKLSYVRVLSSGTFSPAAAFPFQESYVVAPLDPEIAHWRVHFGLEVWPALSNSSRQNVLGEMRALWAYGPSGQEKMVSAVRQTANPLGRATGEAVLAKLGWNPGTAGN